MAFRDFRQSGEFFVLRADVRGLGPDGSDEGLAIERTIRRLAVAYGVNMQEVFAAVQGPMWQTRPGGTFYVKK